LIDAFELFSIVRHINQNVNERIIISHATNSKTSQISDILGSTPDAELYENVLK